MPPMAGPQMPSITGQQAGTGPQAGTAAGTGTGTVHRTAEGPEAQAAEPERAEDSEGTEHAEYCPPGERYGKSSPCG